MVRPAEQLVWGRPERSFQSKGGDPSAVDRGRPQCLPWKRTKYPGERYPQEIFKKLGDNFGLDDGVIDALVQLGVESLQGISFLMGT